MPARRAASGKAETSKQIDRGFEDWVLGFHDIENRDRMDIAEIAFRAGYLAALSSKPPRRGRKGERKRGASIIEAAFALPIMLAMILAFVEVGWVMAARACVQHSVREGSRYGVTGRRMVDPTAAGLFLSHEESIKRTVSESAVVFPVQASEVIVTYRNEPGFDRAFLDVEVSKPIPTLLPSSWTPWARCRATFLVEPFPGHP